MNLSKLSMVAAISVTLAACGGGGGGSGTSGNTGGSTTTSAIRLSPMKGKFSVGTTVRVKRTSDSLVVGSCKIDATGSCSASVATSEKGPFLIEAGIAGDTYFDESTGANATVPVGQTALRALIPDATTSTDVGVTALTEFAVGQVEAGSGVTAVTPIAVVAANATIGSQFGVSDLLTPPTMVDATTQVSGGNAADDYALKLAGLAKMAASGTPSLQALHDLRDDIKDGKFDGLKGATPLTTLAFTVPPAGMTPAELSTQIATQVQAATATYGTASATAPTVTLTVQDLAALLAAAMQVGAEAERASAGSQLTAAQLNTQIASTVNTQVVNIATEVAKGTAIATATTAAVTNTTTTATALASAGGTAQADFMAGITGGWYQYAPWLAPTTPAPVVPAGGQITQRPYISKSVGVSGTSGMTVTNSEWAWDFAAGALVAYTPPQGSSGWVLTATSPGGWVAEASPSNMKITSNADGSISWSDSTHGTSGKFFPGVKVLDGLPFSQCLSATNPTGANCAAGDVYPAGSKMYDFVGEVNNEDRYGLWTGGGNFTDASGNPATVLPALGTSFCAMDNYFRAIPGAAAGANNYDIIYAATWDPVTQTSSNGCTAASITAANAISSAANNRTVLIVNKATGNTSVPTLLKVQRVSQTNDAWLLNRFFGAVNGAVYNGDFMPAGPVQNNNDYPNLNKTAMDAELAFAVGRTAVMRYITNATSVNGVTELWNTGNVTGVTLVAITKKWLAGATAGTYTQTEDIQEFTNGAWVAKTALTETYPAYYLTAANTAWAQWDGTLTWTLNPDGTLTTVTPRTGTLTMDIVRTNLAGTAIMDPNGGGQIGTYPASGANGFTQVGATSAVANYRIFVEPWSVVTDANGVQLTALPAAGATICTQGVVLQNGVGGYDAFSTVDCTAPSITAALATPPIATGVILGTMPALNGAAPTVYGITAAPGATWLVNSIIAVAPGGGVYAGNYQPVGKKLGFIFDKSRAAADAEAIAMGALAIP